ncbi:helix-turn-helix domain-containing protein [Azotobacter sp. CWF10]
MHLTHKIALRPTSEQADYFARACGTARKVWNWALDEWSKQYAGGGKPNAMALKSSSTPSSTNCTHGSRTFTGTRMPSCSSIWTRPGLPSFQTSRPASRRTNRASRREKRTLPGQLLRCQ